MSKLLALDIDKNKNYSFNELQIILSHIGQNRSYFFATIPPPLMHLIKESFESSNLSSDQRYKLMSMAEKITRSNSIIKKSYQTKGFIKDVINHHNSDARLELAITDTSHNNPIIKKFEDLDLNDDFNGPKSYSGSYEFEQLWPWLEFYVATAGQLIIMSANNEITDNIDRITTFGIFLQKLLKKIPGTLCKKITIYSVEKEPIHTKCFVDNDLFKRTMQQIINNSNLPEFGIKFFIVNKRDKKRIHSRRLITNHIYMKLDDDLGGKSANKEISVEPDPKKT